MTIKAKILRFGKPVPVLGLLLFPASSFSLFSSQEKFHKCLKINSCVSAVKSAPTRATSGGVSPGIPLLWLAARSNSYILWESGF